VTALQRDSAQPPAAIVVSVAAQPPIAGVQSLAGPVVSVQQFTIGV